MIKEFKRTVTGDLNVDQLQKRLHEFLQPFTESAIIDGVQLDGVELTTASKAIAHKLGRKPLGWIVVRKNSNANVWETAELTDKFITLQSSLSTTVSIWIY